MSASFSAGLNAIVPLFILIGLGYLARRTVLDSRLLPGLNTFVYYFAVPALLFNASSQQPLTHIFNIPALVAFALAALVTALIAASVCGFYFKVRDFSELVMRGLNATFANFAYMGIPLIVALLGDKAHGAMIAIILAGNLLLIAGAQLLIQAHEQGSLTLKSIWVIIDKALVRSPIFISTTLGLLWSGLHLPVPDLIHTTLTMLAPAAIPVALFCLGAGLQFNRAQFNIAELSWLIALKLIVHPTITYLSFKALGVDDPVWLLTTVLLTSLPTGALAHVVAMKYNRFATETAQIVVISTLLSLLSVATWAALLL